MELLNNKKIFKKKSFDSDYVVANKPFVNIYNRSFFFFL